MKQHRFIWSEQAEAAGRSLPEAARAELERRLEFLRDMPHMYAPARDARFPGCRSFWVEPCFRIYYMVGAAGRDVYITAIVQEEVQEVA